MNGELVEVYCYSKPLELFQFTPDCCECRHSDSGIMIDTESMREHVDARDVVKPEFAPNGLEWRYECSEMEKMFMEECWNSAISTFNTLSAITLLTAIVYSML